MKIGTSLSLCIRDICMGKVHERDVLCLITGTYTVTDDQWWRLLNQYKHEYWRKFPDLAETYANIFRNQNRLVQPRTFDMNPISTKTNGIWIEIP